MRFRNKDHTHPISAPEVVKHTSSVHSLSFYIPPPQILFSFFSLSLPFPSLYFIQTNKETTGALINRATKRRLHHLESGSLLSSHHQPTLARLQTSSSIYDPDYSSLSPSSLNHYHIIPQSLDTHHFIF